MEMTVGAILPVVACILAAIVAVYVLVYWAQVIQQQLVSVQSCRWGTGFWGSLLCVLIWIAFVVEIVFYIEVLLLVVYFTIQNIRVLI